MKKKVLLSAGVVLGAAIGAVAFAVPAEAALIVSTSYRVVDQTTVSTHYTQKSQVIGSCKALSSGGTCTVTSGKSSTVSIGLDLGISRSLVASSIHFTSESSRSISAGCTSGRLSAGQTWKAYAVGTFKQYKAEKTEIGRAGGSKTTTSGTLSAFQASGTDIACGLA